jgi:hypothetical protein
MFCISIAYICKINLLDTVWCLAVCHSLRNAAIQFAVSYIDSHSNKLTRKREGRFGEGGIKEGGIGGRVDGIILC